MKKKVLLLITLFAVMCGSVVAQVPATLNLQGVLYDNDGNPYDGNVTIVVELFTAATGGTAIFTDNLGPVTLDKGYFNIQIGANSSNPVPNLPNIAKNDLWYELTVDGTRMARIKFDAVPFSWGSKWAESAGEALVFKGKAGGPLLTGNYPDPDINESVLSGYITKVLGSANIKATPTGKANGGDIYGEYPDGLLIGAGKVTSEKIGHGAVETINIHIGAVTLEKIHKPDIITQNNLIWWNKANPADYKWEYSTLGKVVGNDQLTNNYLPKWDAANDIFVNSKIEGTPAKTIIHDNLEVTGTVLLGDSLDVMGSIHTHRSLFTDLAANIGTTLNVAGNSTLHGTVTIDGATIINNTLDVTGNTHLFSDLRVDLNQTIGGNLGVTGNTNVGLNLTVGGTANIAGATTLNNTLNVAGNTNLASNLYVGGTTELNQLATLNHGLTVLADSTKLLGGLRVANGARIANSLIVDGNSTLNGTLGVTGNTNLGANLTVTGTTILNNTTINNGLTVLGGMTVNGNSTFDSIRATAGTRTARLFVDDEAFLNNTEFTGYLYGTTNASHISTLGNITGANLTSTGRTTVGNQLIVNGGGATINGLTTLNDNLNVIGATTLNETIISGATVINNTFDVIGLTTLNATNITGATLIDNTLTVTGKTALAATDIDSLNVIGRTNLHNDVQIEADGTKMGAYYTGTTSATWFMPATWNDQTLVTAGYVDRLLVDSSYIPVSDGTQYINSPIRVINADSILVGASLTVGSTLIPRPTFLNGTLNVLGATALNNTLNVTGATALNNTLNVTGATALASTLDVTGATTLNNTLDVTGATTLNNTLDVTGATALASTLDVVDLVTFQDRADYPNVFAPDYMPTGSTAMTLSTKGYVDAINDALTRTYVPYSEVDATTGHTIFNDSPIRILKSTADNDADATYINALSGNGGSMSWNGANIVLGSESNDVLKKVRTSINGSLIIPTHSYNHFTIGDELTTGSINASANIIMEHSSYGIGLEIKNKGDLVYGDDKVGFQVGLVGDGVLTAGMFSASDEALYGTFVTINEDAYSYNGGSSLTTALYALGNSNLDGAVIINESANPLYSTPGEYALDVTGNTTISGTLNAGNTTLGVLTAGATTLASANVTGNATVGGRVNYPTNTVVAGPINPANGTVFTVAANTTINAGTNGQIIYVVNTNTGLGSITVNGTITVDNGTAKAFIYAAGAWYPVN